VHKDIFRIVEVCMRALLDHVDNSRFQIHKNSSGNKVVIVCLVEKYILSVSSVCGEIFQDPLRRNS